MGKENKNSQYEGKPFSRVIGIDVANSTIKTWTDDNKHLEYRNTIKEVNDAGLVYSFKTDYQMFVYNKEVYEVGDITAMGSGGRGKARYNSASFKIEALIGIASILTPGVKDKLRVVTGLPSSLSKNNAVAEEIKRSLIGDYLIKSVKWDLIDDIAFVNNDMLKNTLSQKSNHHNIIVSKDLYALTGGKEDIFAAIIGEAEKTVLFSHNSSISCEKWSKYIGEYDKIDVANNRNSGWGQSGKWWYNTSDGQTETLKREHKVKPEQINRLSQNEAFIFDHTNGNLIQTVIT